MGLRPTLGEENRRRPREGGDPWRVDSRFRGNDVVGATFWRATFCSIGRGEFKPRADGLNLVERFGFFQRRDLRGNIP